MLNRYGKRQRDWSIYIHIVHYTEARKSIYLYNNKYKYHNHLPPITYPYSYIVLYKRIQKYINIYWHQTYLPQSQNNSSRTTRASPQIHSIYTNKYQIIRPIASPNHHIYINPPLPLPIHQQNHIYIYVGYLRLN